MREGDAEYERRNRLCVSYSAISHVTKGPDFEFGFQQKQSMIPLFFSLCYNNDYKSPDPFILPTIISHVHFLSLFHIRDFALACIHTQPTCATHYTVARDG